LIDYAVPSVRCIPVTSRINPRVTIKLNQPFSRIAEDAAMDWAAIATLALIAFVIVLVILISINLRG
jgi:hypothetical protein